MVLESLMGQGGIWHLEEQAAVGISGKEGKGMGKVPEDKKNLWQTHFSPRPDQWSYLMYFQYYHSFSSVITIPLILSMIFNVFFLKIRALFLKINLVFNFYLFIFGCIGSLLLRTGFLQLWQAGAILCRGAQASRCSSFSCCGARALSTRASVVVAHGLSSCGSQGPEHRLSSCGVWAQLLRGMWDLPRPRARTCVPCIGRRILNHSATREILCFKV